MTRFLAACLALLLCGAVPAAAQVDEVDPFTAWDAAAYTVDRGVSETISGVVAGADDDARVVVERRDGGDWVPVRTRQDDSRFSAEVPGEAGTYRAVLTSGGEEFTSDELVVSADPAQSNLVVSLPASAKDKSTVTARVTWRRTADDAPLSGKVELIFKRRGLSTFEPVRLIEVTDGVGTTELVPRDDGYFAVRWVGDEQVAAVTSATDYFNNVPVLRIWMRLGHYNLPGEDKLALPAERAAKAASQINAANLDVVTFNELVGPGVDGSSNPPSGFARSVVSALGSPWVLLTPTMKYNENYIAYRSDRVELIAQYPDRVVPGVGSGEERRATARHLTPVLLKDSGSNTPFFLGATHLVNNDRPGAHEQAYSVGDHATELANKYPVVVAGDMNTAGQLKGLTRHGLKDVRRSARETTHASYATHVKYSATKPVKDSSWIIDQVYVPSSWVASQWTTHLATKNGLFTKPRASDHMLVWSTLIGQRP